MQKKQPGLQRKMLLKLPGSLPKQLLLEMLKRKLLKKRLLILLVERIMLQLPV